MSSVRPFHEPVEIHIGDQTRHLMLTPEAWQRAQRALNGRDPREALAGGGLDPVVIVAAFALHHEKKKTSDRTVLGWITHEPEKTVDLIDAVAECARRFLVTIGTLDDEQPAGEAKAP
jgi:hypothetical protein